MAHPQQIKAVEVCIRDILNISDAKTVLEVGSWAEHGGDFRYLFPSANYTGIDVSDGPGVDIVCKGEEAAFPSSHFDVVLSSECFEHNRFWRETLANMIRMCKPGGGIIVTCAGLGRPEHGTSRTTISASLTSSALGDDYYSNLAITDFRKTGLLGSLADYAYSINRETCDFYLVGIKKNYLNPTAKLPSKSSALLRGCSSSSQKNRSPVATISFTTRYLILATLERMMGERRYHSLRLLHQKSGFSFRRPLSFLSASNQKLSQ